MMEKEKSTQKKTLDGVVVVGKTFFGSCMYVGRQSQLEFLLLVSRSSLLASICDVEYIQ